MGRIFHTGRNIWENVVAAVAATPWLQQLLIAAVALWPQHFMRQTDKRTDKQMDITVA